MTPSTVYYLRFVSFMSAFRTFMYIFNHDHVTRVKIAKNDWENLKIRDLAYTWTRTVRFLMMFRTLVYGLGSCLQNDSERKVLTLLSFAFDVYMVVSILKERVSQAAGRKDSAREHQSPNAPLFIQSLHIIAFALAIYYE